MQGRGYIGDRRWGRKIHMGDAPEEGRSRGRKLGEIHRGRGKYRRGKA